MSRASILRVVAVAAAVAALVLPLAVAAPATADARQQRLVATYAIGLSGAQEVPPVAGGQTAAFVLLVPRAGLACWAIGFDGVVGTPTRLHIHRAPAGSNGPVVVPFFDQVVNPSDVAKQAGCVRADRAVLQAVVDNPANYYLNLHTDVFPPGAVRGQLG